MDSRFRGNDASKGWEIALITAAQTALPSRRRERLSLRLYNARFFLHTRP